MKLKTGYLGDIYFQQLLDICDVELSVQNIRMFIIGSLIGVEPCNSIHVFQTLIAIQSLRGEESKIFECFLNLWNDEEERLRAKSYPQLIPTLDEYVVVNDKHDFLTAKLAEFSFFFAGLKESKGVHYLEYNVDLLSTYIYLSTVEDLIEEYFITFDKKTSLGNVEDDILTTIHVFNERIWPRSFFTMLRVFYQIRMREIALEQPEIVKTKVVELIKKAAIEEFV